MLLFNKMYESILYIYIETCRGNNGNKTKTKANKQTNYKQKRTKTKKPKMATEYPKRLPRSSILGHLLMIFMFIICAQLYISVPVEYSAQYRWFPQVVILGATYHKYLKKHALRNVKPEIIRTIIPLNKSLLPQLNPHFPKPFYFVTRLP